LRTNHTPHAGLTYPGSPSPSRGAVRDDEVSSEVRMSSAPSTSATIRWDSSSNPASGVSAARRGTRRRCRRTPGAPGQACLRGRVEPGVHEQVPSLVGFLLDSTNAHRPASAISLGTAMTSTATSSTRRRSPATNCCDPEERARARDPDRTTVRRVAGTSGAARTDLAEPHCAVPGAGLGCRQES
jgi:hypothetical protein